MFPGTRTARDVPPDPPFGVTVLSFRTSLRHAAFCLAAPLIAGAQEHPDVTSIGNGARALGLSHATTAVSEDASAIGWNPAGLSYLERREFLFVGRMLILGTSASATDFTPNTFPKFQGAGEITGALDPIEFIGIATPYHVLNRTVTAGIAYRRFTEGVRAGTFETRRVQSNGRYKGSTLFASTGGVRALSPSIGIELTPRIRVGATANLLSGSGDYRIRGPHPYEYEAREIDYSGLAMEVGALVTVRDGLRLGAQATLPHDRTMTFDNDTSSRNVTRRAPLAIAIGMALDLNEGTRLSADLRHAPWSEAKFVETASGDSVGSRVGVNDANSIHVGYERDISNEQRDAKFRLGAFARRTTARDLKGRAISAFGISGGRSWLYERVGVDFGMMYARSSRWTRSENTDLRMDLTQHDLLVSLALRRFF